LPSPLANAAAQQAAQARATVILARVIIKAS
jgi:hypothetical protein